MSESEAHYAVVTEAEFVHEAGCPPSARLEYTDGEVWCMNCDSTVPAHLEPLENIRQRGEHA